MLLLLVMLVPIGHAQLSGESFGEMTPAQVDGFLRRLDTEKTPFAERVLRVSERFLGVPYVNSPLGEGAGHEPDPDPLIRLDAVDCTTFLEQTMALSHASSLQEALELLRRIRYRDGKIAYLDRKHFMMSQWIPLNQKEGFLVDVTSMLAGDQVSWVHKRLDASVWERRKRKDKYPLLTGDQVPAGDFRLPVIGLDRAREYVNRIPSGTILNVVRADFRSVPIRVSHQGLVVVRKGRRYLRHAARSAYKRVVDELLDTFLRRNQAYRKWPVVGVNLQRIVKYQGAQVREKEP